MSALVLPLNKEINFDTIKKFCSIYYPSSICVIDEGIFGQFIRLQDNDWDFAKIEIVHDEIQNKTCINTKICDTKETKNYKLWYPRKRFKKPKTNLKEIDTNLKIFLETEYGQSVEESAGFVTVEGEMDTHSCCIHTIMSIFIIALVLLGVYLILDWKDNNCYSFPYYYVQASFGDANIPLDTEADFSLENNDTINAFYQIVISEADGNNDEDGLPKTLYRLCYKSMNNVLIEEDYYEGSICVDNVLWDKKNNYIAIVNYSDNTNSPFYYNLFRNGEPVFKDKELIDLRAFTYSIFRYEKTNGEKGYCDMYGKDVGSYYILLDAPNSVIWICACILAIILLVIFNKLAKKISHKVIEKKMKAYPIDKQRLFWKNRAHNMP